VFNNKKTFAVQLPVFKAGGLNHPATLPWQALQSPAQGNIKKLECRL
jgi:hypothetical protein